MFPFNVESGMQSVVHILEKLYAHHQQGLQYKSEEGDCFIFRKKLCIFNPKKLQETPHHFYMEAHGFRS